MPENKAWLYALGALIALAMFAWDLRRKDRP
jgi:hypothetical protein